MEKVSLIILAALLGAVLVAFPAFTAAEDPVVEAVDKYLSNLPSDYFQMKPKVLNQKLGLGEDWFILDVRRPEEFSAGHLEGAINIPVHEIAKRIGLLPKDRNTPIVVYCRSGVRSMFATSALLVLGYECVYNMSGGFLAWQEAGFPIDR